MYNYLQQDILRLSISPPAPTTERTRSRKFKLSETSAQRYVFSFTRRRFTRQFRRKFNSHKSRRFKKKCIRSENSYRAKIAYALQQRTFELCR